MVFITFFQQYKENPYLFKDTGKSETKAACVLKR